MGWFFIGYSLLINTSFLLLTVLAVADFVGYRRRVEFAAYDESFGEPLARGITVLMPAYNESETIIESVQAMMAMRYPDFEVIVVDDGSRDDTVAKLVAEFDLVEVPMVVDRLVPMKGQVHATVPLPQGQPQPGAGHQEQRRQGRRAQRGDQPGPQGAGLHGRRGLAARPRLAAARVATVRRPPGPGGRRRRRHPGRERLDGHPGPRRRRPDAAHLAGPGPGRRVPPRVPDRPRRLVRDRGAPDHLRRVRHLPQGRAGHRRRDGHRLHRRGCRAGGADLPVAGRGADRRQGRLRLRTGRLDRGAGEPSGAAPSSGAVGTGASPRS